MELLFTTEKLWIYGKNDGMMVKQMYYGQTYGTIPRIMDLRFI